MHDVLRELLEDTHKPCAGTLAEHPPEGWRADRRRWHTYQGVRAVLLGVWFLCAVGAVTLA